MLNKNAYLTIDLYARRNTQKGIKCEKQWFNYGYIISGNLYFNIINYYDCMF